MSKDKDDNQDRNYKRLAWIVVIVALVAVFSYGLQIAVDHPLHSALALSLLATAPLALGALLGFLFGIPKTASEPPPTSPDGPPAKRHAWETNTNLEQVSDWLTKILIGIGLTQLQQLPDALRTLGDYVAQTFVPSASAPVISALFVTFFIVGFIISYLITKFDLSHAIDEQDGLTTLQAAVVKNPNDRAAVEALMMSSLYAPSPKGYKSAIQSGEAFLAQEGHPQLEDDNVFAYLACAYGQQYADAKEAKASAEELEAIKAKVIDAANNAIARDPTWTAKLRQYANPPMGSLDDDLAALKDDPKLKPLLAGDVGAMKTR